MISKRSCSLYFDCEIPEHPLVCFEINIVFFYEGTYNFKPLLLSLDVAEDKSIITTTKVFNLVQTVRISLVIWVLDQLVDKFTREEFKMLWYLTKASMSHKIINLISQIQLVSWIAVALKSMIRT